MISKSTVEKDSLIDKELSIVLYVLYHCYKKSLMTYFMSKQVVKIQT